jgi:uncharacterized protein
MSASVIESQKNDPGSCSLKPSRYNAFVRLDDGRYYGYNCLYDSLIQLTEETFSKVSERLNDHENLASPEVFSNDLGKANLESLRKSRFVIDANISELSILKHFHKSAVYTDSIARLIVLPTTNCNFNCPYCYECKDPMSMSTEMEDHLISFVKTRFSTKRNIQIAWFGGEPLLAFESILRISRKMRSFCESIHSTYSSTLTTNGYFLDQSFIDSLSLTSIKHIQVTFDGDQTYHDYMRQTKAGNGSFERLRENIVRFCETVSETDCNLTIRVNLCDESYDSVESFLDRFPISVKNRCEIFFRMIYDNEEAKKRGFSDFSSNTTQNGRFNAVESATAKARMSGWKTVDQFYIRSFTFCEVDLKDQYTVYPNGDVFLCNHDISPKMRLFNISSPDRIAFQDGTALQANWLSLDPFSDKECVDCNILPICQGGCRLARYRGAKSCMKEPNSNRSIFLNAIKSKMGLRASECPP